MAICRRPEFRPRSKSGLRDPLADCFANPLNRKHVRSLLALKSQRTLTRKIVLDFDRTTVRQLGSSL